MGIKSNNKVVDWEFSLKNVFKGKQGGEIYAKKYKDAFYLVDPISVDGFPYVCSPEDLEYFAKGLMKMATEYRDRLEKAKYLSIAYTECEQGQNPWLKEKLDECWKEVFNGNE